MPSDEQKSKDEKKPDIAALLNQQPIPKEPQIIPQPPPQKIQPNHPTGKLQNQLEQIWAKVKAIDVIGSNSNFIIEVLTSFGMLLYDPTNKQFNRLSQKQLPYPAIVNGLKAMQKEIEEIKTDIQFMKKTMMGEPISVKMEPKEPPTSTKEEKK